MVDHGHVHRPEHAVGDRARSWNLQKMPTVLHVGLRLVDAVLSCYQILHSFYWQSIQILDTNRQSTAAGFPTNVCGMKSTLPETGEPIGSDDGGRPSEA